MNLFVSLLLLALVAFSLFLGLFPHSDHINILGTVFPFFPMASHTGHIIMGFIFYALAVFVAQYPIIY
jgi:hypothetical protein